MFRAPFIVTRRAFLSAAAAGLVRPSPAWSQPQAAAEAETLYNGIVLARPWPPRRLATSLVPQRPPYLANPPAVIPIDVGRQLFVDDFLIEESTLHRSFHRPVYHPANPLLTPVRTWERHDPYSVITGTAPSHSAMVYSDGVFYDPADQLLKMWYMGGYQQHTALAVSTDGIEWRRPTLDVVPGTNIVMTHHRDSSTVWLDHDAADPRARFKMAVYDFGAKAMRLHQSPDGVHWRDVGIAGPCADRSTMFRNPFRGVWSFSLRADEPGSLNRVRHYVESRQFAAAQWDAAGPVPWVGADLSDLPRADLQTRPQLYNVDAVAYESLMLGLFTMYRGEKPDREKPNDLCVAFSRDGFHWSRPWPEPFIPVSERQGDWNWSNVQSAGGVCAIVGDRLHFYVSGRRGVPGTNMPGECSTGLATLRRDGFAAVGDEWPAGSPRPAARRATLTTRPLRFTGRYLFVNAVIDGSLRIEVLDVAGRVIEPFSLEQSVPVTGDGTRLAARWHTRASLEELVGRDVRFRFSLAQARLFAFWVSPTAAGHSRGYVAAGGPGFAKSRDDN